MRDDCTSPNSFGAPGVVVKSSISSFRAKPNLGATTIEPNSRLMVSVHATATSKSVYFQGSTVGQIISAPVMVAVYEADPTLAWYLSGGMMLLSSLCMTLVEVLISSRLKEDQWKARSYQDKLNEQQRREFLETGALPADEFMESLRSDVEGLLDKRHWHLWNGRVQRLVRRAVDNALPAIREYDPREQGRGHLEDLVGLMGKNGMAEDAAEIRRRHVLDVGEHEIGWDAPSGVGGLGGAGGRSKSGNKAGLELTELRRQASV